MSKLSKAQAGRLGGKATASKHGKEHMRAIGTRGAQAFWKKYTLRKWGTSDFMIVERETGIATGKTIKGIYIPLTPAEGRSDYAHTSRD